MLRALSTLEIAQVAGRGLLDSDWDSSGGDDVVVFAPSDYGDGGGGGGPLSNGGWSPPTPTYTDSNGDIVVTAPFTHDQVESMWSTAEWETDAEIVAIGAGSGGVGELLELSSSANIGLAAGTSAATNHVVADKLTAANFQAIYDEQLGEKMGWIPAGGNIMK